MNLGIRPLRRPFRTANKSLSPNPEIDCSDKEASTVPNSGSSTSHSTNRPSMWRKRSRARKATVPTSNSSEEEPRSLNDSVASTSNSDGKNHPTAWIKRVFSQSSDHHSSAAIGHQLNPITSTLLSRSTLQATLFRKKHSKECESATNASPISTCGQSTTVYSDDGDFGSFLGGLQNDDDRHHYPQKSLLRPEPVASSSSLSLRTEQQPKEDVKSDYDIMELCQKMLMRSIGETHLCRTKEREIIIAVPPLDDERESDLASTEFVPEEGQEVEELPTPIEKHGHPLIVFDKSEIINMLFPHGHPDSKHGKKMPSVRNEMEAHPRRKEPLLPDVGKMVLHGSFDHESLESPFRELSTIDTESSGAQDDLFGGGTTTRVGENDDGMNDVHATSNGGLQNVYNRSKMIASPSSSIIGMEISFDPTWDLLEQQSSPVAVAKSRLRKLQEIEIYVDSLLDRYAKDESSDGSANLLAELELSIDLDAPEAMDVTASCHGETNNRTPKLRLRTRKFASEMEHLETSELFELGCHFDPIRFPAMMGDDMEYIEEVEIAFEHGCKKCAVKVATESSSPVGKQVAVVSAKDDTILFGLNVHGCKSIENFVGDIVNRSSANDVGVTFDIDEGSAECGPHIEDDAANAPPLPTEWLLPHSPICSMDEDVEGFNDFLSPSIPPDGTNDACQDSAVNLPEEETYQKHEPLSATSSKGTHLTAGTTLSSCSFSLLEDQVDSHNFLHHDLRDDASREQQSVEDMDVAMDICSENSDGGIQQLLDLCSSF